MAAEVQRETSRGEEGSPEDTTGSRQALIHPASWSTRGQYGNSPMRGASELFLFFFYNIGSIIIKKKKNGGKGLKSNSESVVRLQRTVPSEPDVPELQEWFDCSAALKKKPKINKNIKSNIVGSALLEVRRERVGSLAKT